MVFPEKFIAAEAQIFSLGRVLQSLREEDNVEVMIKTTISFLQEQFNYKLIWIALYDRVNHILFGKGGFTPGNDTNFLQQRVVLSPGDLLEQVVIEQRPLGVADLRNENRVEEWQQLARKYNIQGTIFLPIRYKDRCMGVVLLGSERWGYLLGAEDKARLLILLGELGAELYQSEINLQHQQIKHPDESLIKLLDSVRTSNNLGQRLAAVVQATHEFASPTRTNIYWFEPEGRYFWRRVSNQTKILSSNQNNQQVAGITVQELSDFYYALSVNQVVSIGEARSSLQSNFTGKLLQRLRVRSLLAAPIIWQNDLLGFLALESNEARIWTQADTNFLKGAAGLISLVAPSESVETTINQIQQNSELTSQVAQGIYSDSDFEEVLRNCALKVLERLGASRFLLLQYNPDQDNYRFIYQSQPVNRRSLTFTLDACSLVDLQLVQFATVAVGIENLEEDLRFFNWRSLLMENGVRSLLISNCSASNAPEALLIVTHEANRAWTTLEKELLQIVAQQIGVIVRQWELHRDTQQQQQILQSFQQCLRVIEQAHATAQSEKKHLEITALQQIASILNCPLAVLFSWMPGENVAEIIPGFIANNQFAYFDAPVPIHTEVLIQWALATDGLLSLNVNDLPDDTRKWLHGAGIGQVLVMALRTSPDYQPTGVILLADNRERHWSEQSLNIIETLICQLSWSRRWLQITQSLETTTEELQQLNWYKHRRLEEVQRTTTLLVSQINDLGVPVSELAIMRYQQMLRQLDHNSNSMTALVKVEQWELEISCETIPIASLLKRSLEKVDNLVKQQRLWVGVHGLGQSKSEQSPESDLLENKEKTLGYQSSIAIVGDIGKIELVMHELLLGACQRSLSGGRIDIWCRGVDERFLEVSITDNGTIANQLLTDLHPDTPKDLLAPSTLNHPPGLHLQICQKLMQKLKGELDFYKLPDNRVVSRLLLPLANNNDLSS